MELFLTTIFVHSNPVHTKEDKSWENEAKKHICKWSNLTLNNFLIFRLGVWTYLAACSLVKHRNYDCDIEKVEGKTMCKACYYLPPLFLFNSFWSVFYWIFCKLKVKFSHYLYNLAFNIEFTYSTNYLNFFSLSKIRHNAYSLNF